MNKIFAFIAFLLLQNFYVEAQSFAINTTGTTAHASAMLDVTSTTKGLLIPRLTSAQRTAIASPGKGLLVYDSTLKSFYFHDGVNWQQINADSNNLWRKNGNDIYNSNTGNVGIGISSPKSLLNVRGGTVLFDSTIGATPVSGAGTRLMWIPAKAAFRAGLVSGSQWDDANIGLYSLATGSDTKASGSYSTAVGINTIASGSYSTAIGYSTSALGNSSLSMGCWGALASGAYAVAIGMGPTASGTGSVAMGSFSNASGDYSLGWGTASYARGNFSVAMGNYVISKSYGGFATGIYNDTTNAVDPLNINPLNRIFQIGNGVAGNSLSNAMTVLQNGNTGIGTTTPVALLQVKKGAVLFDSTIGATPVGGAGTRMMWIPAKAAFRSGAVDGTDWDDVNIGTYSFASGFNSTANAYASTALGDGTIASFSVSTAMGYLSTASGYVSTAMGNGTVASDAYSTSMGWVTTASGISSTSMGYATIASGQSSTVMGEWTRSKSYAGLTIGIYNDSTNAANPHSPVPLNRLFQIGNGTADNARSNAMTVLQNGNVGIGTTTPAYMLTVKNDINVDNGGGNAGTVTNALKFGANGTGEAIGSNRNTGVNQWGLDFYTLSTNRMCISLGGNVGIGETTPTVPLNFASTLGDKISLWGNGVNHYGFGIQGSLMQLYTMDASNDIAFGYGNSAGFNENMRLTGAGDESLKGSLTVQNGMGIIRNNSSTQLKKQTKAVTVNVSLAAGTTTSIALTWPTPFSAGTVEAYVGNITSGGGWAEMIVSVTNVTTTGATLYINNPQSGTLNPNFIVNVIAMGPQ